MNRIRPSNIYFLVDNQYKLFWEFDKYNGHLHSISNTWSLETRGKL